ncbi:MAG: peptidoglycan LD-endopeptidase LytH, partial [Thermoleophilaceae bacterium]|nr:peptidoglycan LD-endopeptidase LytH [Thermoleophilaceae bacterium]
DRTTPGSGGGRHRNNDFTVGGGKQPAIETDVDNKVFYDTKKPARFTFSLDFRDKKYFDDHRVVAKIDLQKKNRKEEIDTWRVPVEDSDDQTIKWDSAAKHGKTKNKAPSPGKYQFVLTTTVDGKVIKPKDGHRADPTTFDFYTNIFPIMGKHEFGGKAGRFGAGRNGHKHQGQDTFAKCGTPLRAARGGKIQANQFQSDAGYYVVIDGDGTDVDYVYMHLKKRSDFREGDKISTGEVFGQVGDTGDAQGCHLHFELWTAPGWFEGGKAYDPLPQLKGWDKFS